MANDQNISIVGWPQEPAELEHQFKKDSPLPVSIAFENTTLGVTVGTSPSNPLAVNMNLNLRALEAIPLCLKLCEPICADSNYTIGITIFDRPVITITVRGRTRIYGCSEEL